MTPKQIETRKNKIAGIKRTLAAEKRKFGAYDDSRGRRYLPTKFYIEIGDYAGGLAYIKWFEKNFPEDRGFPIFLFEWTIILFKNGKTKDAEKKALQTFISNTYILSKFLEKQFPDLDKEENSNWAMPSLAEQLTYSKSNVELLDFSDFLSSFVLSEKFYKIANEFIYIQKLLKTEPVGQVRSQLVNRSYSLLDGY